MSPRKYYNLCTTIKQSVGNSHRAAGPSSPLMTPSSTARPSSKTNDNFTPRSFITPTMLIAPLNPLTFKRQTQELS